MAKRKSEPTRAALGNGAASRIALARALVEQMECYKMGDYPRKTLREVVELLTMAKRDLLSTEMAATGVRDAQE